MEIYVVQPGDNIDAIAEHYGVSAASIIQNNELTNPYDLVPGQTIVIVFPKQTHTVEEGDTLGKIADTYGVTVMQLLRNNPFLTVRDNIYPGESLIISYDTGRNIVTNGYTYSYLSRETLIKTLPSLTYLSVFNYRVETGGELVAGSDDTEVIKTAKDYGTAPLMMTTTFNAQGDPNVVVAIEILTNEEFQNKLIASMLDIIRKKGFYGINMIFSYISEGNINLYNNLVKKVAAQLKAEGYVFFVTVNPGIHAESGLLFEKIDYSTIAGIVDGLSFTHFIWGKNTEPPGPVSSYSQFKQFLDFAVTVIPPDKLRIGMPVLGYDWELPFIAGRTIASSLTLHSALNLALNAGASIQFDEPSQTPFFHYSQTNLAQEVDHVVWFIDARSIASVDSLISEYGLNGKGIWNIMIYYAQMWLIINSHFNVVKVIPDNIG